MKYFLLFSMLLTGNALADIQEIAPETSKVYLEELQKQPPRKKEVVKTKYWNTKDCQDKPMRTLDDSCRRVCLNGEWHDMCDMD